MAELPASPRVLAVRLSSLGDVILTTPVFESLKSARPGCRVSVLVKEKYAEVFRGNPHVDEVLIFERRGFRGWLSEIRRLSFDVYIDLHGTLRSRLWGRFSGIPRRVTYDKEARRRRMLVWFKKDVGGRDRVVDRYLACLEELGVPAASRRPRLYVGADERPPEERERRMGPGPFIGVAPGALHETKRWPAGRFAEAADRLARDLAVGAPSPATTLILGAPADEPAAREVLSSLRGPAVSLAGKTPLRELFLWITRCAVLLTNDSGAMHAACALGVPTVAVFGPTVRGFGFFPDPQAAAVVEEAGLECRPCTLHGGGRCPQGHFRCMRDIAADRAVEAATKLLKDGRRETGDGRRKK